jgi:hypothetical protein
MCSLLKSQEPQAAAARVQNGNMQDVPTQLEGAMTVAEVAAAAISIQRQRTAGLSEATCGSSTQEHSAAVITTADSVPASAAATAPQTASKHGLLMVPWLVLWGRCCLILAQPLYFGSFAKLTAGQQLIPTNLMCLHSWLQESNNSTQLNAAGLSSTGLLKTLEDAVIAWMGLRDAGGAFEHFADLARQKLHALGVSLSSLPLSWGCNNPMCTNLQGPSEEGIVRGKGHVCRACRMARYCGTA